MPLDISGASEVAARFAQLPEKTRTALALKTDALAEQLRDKIVGDKLSGQALNRVTGRLADSIAAQIDDGPSGVGAMVGPSEDVPYAAIQEYGGKTAAHEILAQKGRALAFLTGGKTIFAKKVNHPGSILPERSYLRSSLDEMKDEIMDALTDAVKDAL